MIEKLKSVKEELHQTFSSRQTVMFARMCMFMGLLVEEDVIELDAKSVIWLMSNSKNRSLKVRWNNMIQMIKSRFM